MHHAESRLRERPALEELRAVVAEAQHALACLRPDITPRAYQTVTSALAELAEEVRAARPTRSDRVAALGERVDEARAALGGGEVLTALEVLRRTVTALDALRRDDAPAGRNDVPIKREARRVTAGPGTWSEPAEE